MQLLILDSADKTKRVVFFTQADRSVGFWEEIQSRQFVGAKVVSRFALRHTRDGNHGSSREVQMVASLKLFQHAVPNLSLNELEAFEHRKQRERLRNRR
jgi:hypothetical protein